MALPDLVTTSQAADRLKVSARTIGRWAETGRLPAAHRLPGQTGAYLFDRADVERVALELIAAAPDPSGDTTGGEAA